MKRIFSFSEAGILAICVVVIIIFQAVNPLFLSAGNISTMLRGSAYTGIIAIGMALCLMSGTLDLSVGSTAGLASVVVAKAMVQFNFPFLPALILAVIIGIIVGIINGIVITKLKVNAFIATIAMSFIIKGIANTISSGFSIYPLPQGMVEFGEQRLWGVSIAFWVMLVVMVLAFIVLKFTVTGLEIRATGSDRESAICTDVNVDLVNIKTLAIVGGLAGLSGVLLTLVLNAGTPTLGGGWELNIITAAAIGGVSLSGYEGSMVGLFLGLIFLQIVQNGLILLGLSAYLQPVAVGLILLISMSIDSRRRRFLNLEKI